MLRSVGPLRSVLHTVAKGTTSADRIISQMLHFLAGGAHVRSWPTTAGWHVIAGGLLGASLRTLTSLSPKASARKTLCVASESGTDVWEVWPAERPGAHVRPSDGLKQGPAFRGQYFPQQLRCCEADPRCAVGNACCHAARGVG